MSGNIQELNMSANVSQPPAAARSVVAALLPIVTGVFVAYLVIGLAMPVLPLHVHEGLGLGAFVVGLVAGVQFAASLLSRFWSGHYADSRGGGAPLPSIAQFRRYSGDVSHDPAGGPGSAWRSRELHRVGGAHLGASARKAAEHGQGHVMGRDGDVRRLCGRRTGRHRPVRRLRLCGDCARDDADPARHSAARRAASSRPANTACPSFIDEGRRRRLGAWHRPGVQQRRFRRDHDGHSAALCTTRVCLSMARSHRFEHRLHHWARRLRPPAGPCRRRQGRVGLRADRGGRPGADLAGALVSAGVVRGGAHRLRLLARVPRLRRGSGPPRAAGKSWPRYGGLHRFSRPGAGTRQPCAGAGREPGRPGRGVPRQRAGRDVRRGYRIAAPICAVARLIDRRSTRLAGW
jgi:hypothetical protein